jgi:two-component sensor histidine kinase
MEMERAIPFGLLLNEIASNAFKYGLGGDSEPSVRATLSLEESTASSNVMLVIEDDGPGIPESATEKSLGLQIAQGLAAQLKGTAVWGKSARGGTRVVVEFPLSSRAGFD